jgi:hypothetical protein
MRSTIDVADFNAALILQIELRSRQIDDHRRRFGIVLTVERVSVKRFERLLNLRFQRDHRLDFAAGGEAKIVERLQVTRVRCGHHQRRAGLEHRHGGVFARDAFGQAGHRFRRYGE